MGPQSTMASNYGRYGHVCRGFAQAGSSVSGIRKSDELFNLPSWKSDLLSSINLVLF